MNQTGLIELVSRGLYYSTLLAVVVSIAAYVLFRLRENGRRSPTSRVETSADDGLELFETYRTTIPMPTEPVEGRAARARTIGIGWGVGAFAVVGGAFMALLLEGEAKVVRSGRQAKRRTPTGPSLAVAGSQDRARPAWRSVMNVAKGSARPVSLFGIPELDHNADGIIQSSERARIHARVPQFILVGVDDNGAIEGIEWLRRLFEDRGVWTHATFFMTANYLSGRPNHLGGPIDEVWQSVVQDNFVGLHGTTHDPGAEHWGVEQWRAELLTVQEELRSRLRAPADWDWATYPWGSRAPFLVYSDAYFEALEGLSSRVVFDSSVQVVPSGAYDRSFDVSTPRDLPWPFRLDAELTSAVLPPDHSGSDAEASIGPHPIWEVPVTTWFFPAHDGLSARWEPSFDFNLWEHFGCEDPEGNDRVIDLVIGNLEGHLGGNRAPFTLGLHAEQFVADEVCHRKTLERVFARIHELRIEGYDLRYADMPELLLWMEERR